MAKNKYIINTEKVSDLKNWCKQRGLSIETFKQSIKRAKLNGSNECYPLGFHVIRL